MDKEIKRSDETRSFLKASTVSRDGSILIRNGSILELHYNSGSDPTGT